MYFYYNKMYSKLGDAMNLFDNITFKNFFRLLPGDLLNPMTIIGALIDIAIITYIIYKLITFVRETRAKSLLQGLILVGVIAIVSDILNLRTITFLIDRIFAFAVLAIVVVFQPEIRRALQKLGTGTLKDLFGPSNGDYEPKITAMVEEVVKACVEMSASYTGALIVIEKEIKVGEYIITGTKIESIISSELILSIFMKNTPLHDGAIIIREDCLVAASCYLPLTDNKRVSKKLGTRHRAAMGISEVSDCIVIVVSEETGKISKVTDGKLQSNLSSDSLRIAILNWLIKKTEKKEKKIPSLKGKKGAKKTKT